MYASAESAEEKAAVLEALSIMDGSAEQVLVIDEMVRDLDFGVRLVDAPTVREADGSLQCYYGPCEYTSARLDSQYKVESAYGRIEARIRVAEGFGLWSAFWSLGADIDRVRWPQAGEIDFGEFVGRQPTEIFGAIHGPGYRSSSFSSMSYCSRFVP